MTISEFTVDDGPELGVFSIAVTCTAGTYIRTLAADLGHHLGGGAHLRRLRRTAVGEFSIEEAGAPDDCELQPVATTVRALERVDIDAETAALVANGRVLPQFSDVVGVGPWAVFGPNGALIAVYEPFRECDVKPSVVLPVAAGR